MYIYIYTHIHSLMASLVLRRLSHKFQNSNKSHWHGEWLFVVGVVIFEKREKRNAEDGTWIYIGTAELETLAMGGTLPMGCGRGRGRCMLLVLVVRCDCGILRLLWCLYPCAKLSVAIAATTITASCRCFLLTMMTGMCPNRRLASA